MRSVGIVCGYDLNDDLPGYVRSVAPLIARENLDFVILSGGRTSPRSDHSEAWVMAGHLREMLPAPTFVLEEHERRRRQHLPQVPGHDPGLGMIRSRRGAATRQNHEIEVLASDQRRHRSHVPGQVVVEIVATDNTDGTHLAGGSPLLRDVRQMVGYEWAG